MDIRKINTLNRIKEGFITVLDTKSYQNVLLMIL